MTNLCTQNEFSYILEDNRKYSDDTFFSGMGRRASEVFWKRGQSFFRPYKDAQDFGGGLIAPVHDPLVLAGIAGAASFAIAVVAAVCVGSLLCAGAAFLFGHQELGEQTLGFITSYAMPVLASALLSTVASLLLCVMSIPYGLAAFASRTALTVGAALSGCGTSEEISAQSSELSI